MEYTKYQILLLHKHPEYLKECVDLINDEWPRSETARIMSLQASCDNLPTSLIILNENKEVVGHCKLTAIPSLPNSCFIETVVISKSMRGKRLGTFLMKKVEEYATNTLKLNMLHLSTKGQENFYAKLGYEICAPISIYGNSLPTLTSPPTAYNVPVKNTINVIANNERTPAPPPPPMPLCVIPTSSNIKSTKTYMFKNL